MSSITALRRLQTARTRAAIPMSIDDMPQPGPRDAHLAGTMLFIREVRWT